MTDEELYKHLEKLTTKYEKISEVPNVCSEYGDNFVRKEMKGASGINIIPTKFSLKANSLRIAIKRTLI